MNRPNLSVMDIYPVMLEDAYGLCEAILNEDYGYSLQNFFRAFDDALRENDLGNLSNRITTIMFELTKDMIKAKDPNAEVSYYVNGTLDTHFYINGEPQ